MHPDQIANLVTAIAERDAAQTDYDKAWSDAYRAGRTVFPADEPAVQDAERRLERAMRALADLPPAR